jgi:hypothetical protein
VDVIGVLTVVVIVEVVLTEVKVVVPLKVEAVYDTLDV